MFLSFLELEIILMVLFNRQRGWLSTVMQMVDARILKK